MTREQLGWVEPSITKENTNYYQALSGGERLGVTLRFLASEESRQPLSFAYLIGKSTLSHIIMDTCDEIFESPAGQYVHLPSSTEKWENITCDFQETWNLPHIVVIIDDKHIRVQCPEEIIILEQGT